MVEKSSVHSPGSSFWPSFYDPFRNFGAKLAEWVAPASEASGDDSEYRIAIELPGVGDGDVEVSVNDGVVTVKGEKRTSREEKGKTWYFSERQFGAFCRSFRLPPDADEEKLVAEMRDGVLTLSVPKAGPDTHPGTRKVEIARG